MKRRGSSGTFASSTICKNFQTCKQFDRQKTNGEPHKRLFRGELLCETSALHRPLFSNQAFLNNELFLERTTSLVIYFPVILQLLSILKASIAAQTSLLRVTRVHKCLELSERATTPAIRFTTDFLLIVLHTLINDRFVVYIERLMKHSAIVKRSIASYRDVTLRSITSEIKSKNDTRKNSNETIIIQ